MRWQKLQLWPSQSVPPILRESLISMWSEYSLMIENGIFVDTSFCTSFAIMEQMGISAALTADRHYRQAGYVALLLEQNS